MIGVGGRGELHSPIGIERVRISLFGRWVIAEGGRGFHRGLREKGVRTRNSGVEGETECNWISLREGWRRQLPASSGDYSREPDPRGGWGAGNSVGARVPPPEGHAIKESEKGRGSVLVSLLFQEHGHVGNIVFQIRFADGFETERLIKMFEVRLRGNFDIGIVQCKALFDCFVH